MKKFVALFIACILHILVIIPCSIAETENAPAAYEKEITFRGIEWGQSVEKVNEALKKESIEMIDGSEAQPLFCERFSPYSSNIHSKYYVGMETFGWPLSENITVAGHKISMITMDYYYDLIDGIIIHDSESTHLYMATYILEYNNLEESYNDLKGKLVQLYGEGQDENDVSSYGIKSHVWYGGNNTAVRITIDYDIPSDPSFYLVYYKTDSTDIIKNLDEIAREEEYKKDQEKWQSNTDGL